jgi:hypothetical protein
MRKFIPYLLFLYLLILVSVVAYSRLTPAPPPPPPSRWSIFWREHGDIVAAGLILMLTLMELAIGVFVLGGVLVLLKKGWTIWAHSVGRSGGLAPVIRDKRGEWLDVNPEGAVIAAAIAAHAPKVTAAMTRNMMDSVIGAGRWSVQDVPFEEPVDASYQVVEEFRPDMVDATGQDAQHHLFVGPTGSGKSVAAFSVLDEMKQQQPEADFYIFEPGGVEWKAQAAATTFEGLFDLVKHFHDEMQRRQQMLAAHPQAVHAFEIGLPPVVLFIEEAGAALDYYKLSPGGKKLSQEFSLYLRNLLREARKTGIGVTLVTQSAMAETFDTQVLDNITHVWLLSKGASPKLLRRWSLTDEFRRLKQAGLLADRPGLAYDYHARRLVQFPKRDRPVLMLEPPKLERIVDGSGAVRSGTSNGSDGTWSGSEPVRVPVRTGFEPVKPLKREKNSGFSGNSRVPVRTGTSVSSEARVNQFDANQFIRQMALRNEREGRSAVISYRSARVVYQQYKQAGSIKGLQRRLWPTVTPGGHRFYWIRDIIEQFENRERSRPTVTVIFPDKKRSDQKSDAQS